MEDDLVTQLTGALHRLVLSCRSLPTGGLPMGEFLMLQLIGRQLERKPDAPGVYVSQLTQCSYVSPPAVSRTLRRLEGKGLVQRRTDPKDRRTTYVVLTEEGQALLTACRQELRLLALRVVERMGGDDLQVLTKQLDRLTEAVREERENISME